MRIGLNLLYLVPDDVGGTETYARELLSALLPKLRADDRLIAYCGQETAPTFAPHPKMRVVTLPFYSKDRAVRLLVEQTLLPIRCFTDRLDVIFSLGYSAPFLHPCPSVVTIHDLNWYYHPEDFGPVSLLLVRFISQMSAFSSSHIITDSQASYASLVSVLGVPSAKVTPILHGTPRVVKVKKRKTGHYLFTVVAGIPHKNLATLLRAFAAVAQTDSKLKLLVCGLGGRAERSSEALIKELGITSRVRLLGYVSPAKLAALYSQAKIFVYPSAYEGFGYPVVEAMSYHVPVISSNAFSLHEVVGKAGIQIDPYDVKAYAKAINSLLSSESRRKKLVKLGSQRVRELSWDKTAVKTLNILNQYHRERKS